jgi:hypothetical protein
MQSLIPTTEFDAGNDIFSRIKTSVHVALARPYGKRYAVIQQYFSKFTDQQLDEFINKLGESKWVRNPSFTYDRIVRDDMVSALLSNGVTNEVSKYYDVHTLIVSR